MMIETPIILDVFNVTVDPHVPQSGVVPRFYRAKVRTTDGDLDLRVALAALPKLAAQLDKAWSGTSVQFVGQGPFDLPLAQAATAAGGTDTVTISFRVGPYPEDAARIAIPKSRALELAQAIAQAAVESSV